MNIRHKKGSVGPIAGMLMMMTGIAMILISIFLAAELGSTINATINNTTQVDLQATFDDASGHINTGLTIMGIALLVIGAGVVISSLKSAF